ncbi:hypothetical protein, conserved [Leishmania tarentolae]|uniref:Uncharacterized protein n=1 Tax=Leishmania tarentolae TaxID=5689 RepID=A0A640KU31_LEITA|nr:hypothetical protein, conserved [Leishmania tarentolae]
MPSESQILRKYNHVGPSPPPYRRGGLPGSNPPNVLCGTASFDALCEVPYSFLLLLFLGSVSPPVRARGGRKRSSGSSSVSVRASLHLYQSQVTTHGAQHLLHTSAPHAQSILPRKICGRDHHLCCTIGCVCGDLHHPRRADPHIHERKGCEGERQLRRRFRKMVRDDDVEERVIVTGHPVMDVFQIRETRGDGGSNEDIWMLPGPLAAAICRRCHLETVIVNEQKRWHCSSRAKSHHLAKRRCPARHIDELDVAKSRLGQGPQWSEGLRHLGIQRRLLAQYYYATADTLDGVYSCLEGKRRLAHRPGTVQQKAVAVKPLRGATAFGKKYTCIQRGRLSTVS